MRLGRQRWAALPRRPGSWQPRAGVAFGSKEALIIKDSKEAKGSWRKSLPVWAGAIMPAFTAGLLPVLGVVSRLGVPRGTGQGGTVLIPLAVGTGQEAADQPL